MDIQTEEYLEELSDRPVEVDADTQTDPLLDRPPSPLFIPKKSGLDAETQMYPPFYSLFCLFVCSCV